MSYLSLYTGKIVEAARDTANQDISELKSRDNTHTGEGINPVCGDRVTWYFTLNGDVIDKIRYKVTGCLMSQASASFLAGFLQGRSIDDARNIYSQILRLAQPPDKDEESAFPDKQTVEQNPWMALAQIRDYPARRKCVTMAWDSFFSTLERANSAK